MVSTEWKPQRKFLFSPRNDMHVGEAIRVNIEQQTNSLQKTLVLSRLRDGTCDAAVFNLELCLTHLKRNDSREALKFGLTAIDHVIGKQTSLLLYWSNKILNMSPMERCHQLCGSHSTLQCLILAHVCATLFRYNIGSIEEINMFQVMTVDAIRAAMFFQMTNVIDDQLYADPVQFEKEHSCLRKPLRDLFELADMATFVSGILDVVISLVSREECIPALLVLSFLNSLNPISIGDWRITPVIRLLRIECLMQIGQLYLALVETDSLLKFSSTLTGVKDISEGLNKRFDLMDVKCQQVSPFCLFICVLKCTAEKVWGQLTDTWHVIYW
ncbi:unnamed protein product [Echinostoma caproni]|uniref:Cohesin loading complex subunit SCC4 homolog n=1 Tax=Echinostoma caproni TaxID=27848 RepID=A0A183AGU6_9TREM|nr:unnamed protein product [Echinostoma caproni]